MHKKLEAELVSLANSILERKNKDDVTALHKKAQEICEKLSVLKFVEAYIDGFSETSINSEEKTSKVIEESVEEIVEDIIEETPEIKEVEELVEAVEEELEITPSIKELEKNIASVEEVIAVVEEEKVVVEEPKETLTHKQVEAIFNTDDDLVKDDVRDLDNIKFSLEEELKDAISSDVATELFEKATKDNPVVEEQPEVKKRSLNDTLFSANLQIGLNDRIAFVKHLFEGSQEDFNRVLSQLNSFKSEEEAKSFLQGFVKPDYDWSEKEEYEERFITIIERKFM